MKILYRAGLTILLCGLLVAITFGCLPSVAAGYYDDMGREITITGTLVLDYQQKFEKSPFFKALRDFYHKYVVFDRVETLWYDTLYYRTIKLQAMIKDYLDMEAKSHEYEGYMGDNV